MSVHEFDGFNMIERDHEDLYIDRDWDDEYDYDMPDIYNEDSQGWYEDDYDYIDDPIEYDEF